MLAGRGASGRKNIFWMTVNKILMKDSKDMMIAFLILIFKVDLQPILDESGQFDFYLLTGIGQRKGNSIGVEPAEVKDLPTTIEALSKFGFSIILVSRNSGAATVATPTPPIICDFSHM